MSDLVKAMVIGVLQRLTDRLFLFTSGRSELFKPLVSYTGFVQSQRIPRFLVQCVDHTIALLGNLLASFVEGARHGDDVKLIGSKIAKIRLIPEARPLATTQDPRRFNSFGECRPTLWSYYSRSPGRQWRLRGFSIQV